MRANPNEGVTVMGLILRQFGDGRNATAIKTDATSKLRCA